MRLGKLFIYYYKTLPIPICLSIGYSGSEFQYYRNYRNRTESQEYIESYSEKTWEIAEDMATSILWPITLPVYLYKKWNK